MQETNSFPYILFNTLDELKKTVLTVLVDSKICEERSLEAVLSVLGGGNSPGLKIRVICRGPIVGQFCLKCAVIS